METIYFNGSIITMGFSSAEEELTSQIEAVLVRDGVIAAAGPLEDIKAHASKNATFEDLGGHCLMPGFIDPHSHFVMNGRMASWCDLSDCTSHSEIISTMKAYMASAGDIPAIIGYGYDHNFLDEGTHPDKRILDQISTDIPVFALHVSLHFACCSSLVLERAGITASTPDPEGGKFGRLEGSDEPNGYLEETGMHRVFGGITPGGETAGSPDAEAMQNAYLRYGVTTAQDGATSFAEMKTLSELAGSGALKMDIIAYPLLTDGGLDTIKAFSEYDRVYKDHLKIGGCKLILDGSPQGRSAWMSEPYLGGDEGYCAYPWLTDGQVLSNIKASILGGRQILVHCNGDAASEQFITSYEKALFETGITEDLRPVMIHCQTVRNDQLDRMAPLKMIASVFVGHVWYWGDVHVMNFGEARGNHISPAKDALDRGLHVNFHQDTPVTRPDVMHSVWCAVNRISRRGNVIGSDQKISVYDALRAVTIEGAYEYFEEESKGSIETGKRADLVILEKSPLEVPETELKNIKVLKTIKDGNVVFAVRSKE